MTLRIIAILFISVLISCSKENEKKTSYTSEPIVGSWQLISGTIIEKGDTNVKEYNKGVSFIKIINDTHFAFLQHDLNKGKDSSAVFVSGGGSYALAGDNYTEHLEYCSAREWEGNDFKFTVTIKNDTLIQEGVEKVENIGVDRINIEKYVRIKKSSL